MREGTTRMNKNEFLAEFKRRCLAAQKAGRTSISPYEKTFAEIVLPLVAAIKWESVSEQYKFTDSDGKNRFCDFVIQEDNDVRIAIEIDGFDKMSRGTGMIKSEFIDWQRRQASLTSQGWYVLRFANSDVMNEPGRCAEHISLMLKKERSKSSNIKLSTKEIEKLDALNEEQSKKIEELSTKIEQQGVLTEKQREKIEQQGVLTEKQSKKIEQQGALTEKQSKKIEQQEKFTKKQTQTIESKEKDLEPMKYSINAFVFLALILVGVIIWLAGGFSGVTPSAIPTPAPVTPPVATSAIPTPAPVTPPVAQTPAGTTCDNPILWQQAKDNIGQTMAVVGPLMKIAIPKNIQGNPIYINVGGVYPSTQRLSAVIWGLNKNKFPTVKSKLVGRSVCIIGLIETYGGAPQIEMKTSSQFNVM